MNAYEFFSQYWWLVFPLMGLMTWTVRIVTCNNFHRERMRILKSYADQGKDIPDALRREFY